MDYGTINVVDIESTCWDHGEPAGNVSEIIEIGISELEISSGNIISNSIYVLPKYSKVSEFCTKLTGITQDLLDSNATQFWRACETLQRKYHSKNRIWASYGGYDLRMFEDQCYRENVHYPFGGKHINVKTLFALKNRLINEVGMADALKIAEIQLEGRHHSGGDDARNIAKILREILK